MVTIRVLRRAWLVGIVLAAAETASPAAAQWQTELKFATVKPANHFMIKEYERFARNIKERTRGRVVVQIHHSGVLGNERDVMEGIQIGTIHVADLSSGVMSTLVPEIGVLDLPFIFSGVTQFHRAVDGEAGVLLKRKAREKGNLHVFGFLDQGFRHVLTVKRPIRSIADFKGMKFRAPDAPGLIRTFELLGTKPTPIPWGEIRTALQTGMVDGLESESHAMYLMKYHEVTDYFAITSHSFTALSLLTSDKSFRGLPSDVQPILQEEAWALIWRVRAVSEAKNADAIKKLSEASKETTRPDLAPMRQAVLPVWKGLGEKIKNPGLVEAVQKPESCCSIF
jgi:tripartite ATP-independent transporter DctP family solute receptor